MKRQGGWSLKYIRLGSQNTSDYLALKAFKWYNAAYADLDGSNADYVSAVMKQYPAIWAVNIGWIDTFLTDKRFSLDMTGPLRACSQLQFQIKFWCPVSQ